VPYIIFVFKDGETTIRWDVIDIKMAIKRYFYKLDRSEQDEANLELEFLKSIHYEWSYNPLMRRCDPEAMAIIDEFLKWLEITAVDGRSMNDFTIKRLLRD
jgi:hypothetical protein